MRKAFVISGFILLLMGIFLYGGGFDAFMVNNFDVYPKNSPEWLASMCASYATEGALWNCFWAVLALFTGMGSVISLFSKGNDVVEVTESIVPFGRLILTVSCIGAFFFSIYMIADSYIKCGGIL